MNKKHKNTHNSNVPKFISNCNGVIIEDARSSNITRRRFIGEYNEGSILKDKRKLYFWCWFFPLFWLLLLKLTFIQRQLWDENEGIFVTVFCCHPIFESFCQMINASQGEYQTTSLQEGRKKRFRKRNSLREKYMGGRGVVFPCEVF